MAHPTAHAARNLGTADCKQIDYRVSAAAFHAPPPHAAPPPSLPVHRQLEALRENLEELRGIVDSVLPSRLAPVSGPTPPQEKNMPGTLEKAGASSVSTQLNDANILLRHMITTLHEQLAALEV